MNSLQISLVQSEITWEDVEANLDRFEKTIEELKTDIIVLPETFTTGFTMNVGEVSEEAFGRTHQWMVKMSSKLNAVITGSYVAEEGGMFFNRLLWVTPGGEYLQYNKKHLFRMAEEDQHFTAGISRTIAEHKGWRILPLICYDLRFPAWSRNHYHRETKTLDYDLLLYVANWPAARSGVWDTLLKARAIENHAYCAGNNRLGSDPVGRSYNGHSAVYGPRGEVLAFSEDEGVLTVTLDHENLSEYREKFPAYLDSID